MTTPRYTKRQIFAAVRRWQRILGLRDWKITVRIGAIPGKHRATCEAAHEYREATLSFDPVAMQAAGDLLEPTVAHEIGHAFNWRLAKLAEEMADEDAFRQERVREAMEDATTMMEHALLHMATTLNRRRARRRRGTR